MSSQMQFHPDEGTPPSPLAALRLDAEKQERVIALATRLQHEHEQTVSAEQIEAAAEEVGLKAQFVRQAVAQIAAESAAATATAQHATVAATTPQASRRSGRDVSPLWTLFGGFVYFFAKGWWKAGVTALVLNFMTGSLAWFVLPFVAQSFVDALEDWKADTPAVASHRAAAFQELADLHRNGLITDAEYREKRAELLDRL